MEFVITELKHHIEVHSDLITLFARCTISEYTDDVVYPGVQLSYYTRVGKDTHTMLGLYSKLQ